MTSTLQSPHKPGVNMLASSSEACGNTLAARAPIANGGMKKCLPAILMVGVLFGAAGCSEGDAEESSSSSSSIIASSSSSSVISSSSSVSSSLSSSISSSSSSVVVSSSSSSVSSSSSSVSSSSSSVSSSSSSVTSSSSSSSSTAPVSTVPTTYPKDGFCNTAGANWAWCEDFDGQGANNAKAAFVPANSGVSFQSHSHTTMTGTLCETSVDCTPHVTNGTLMLNPEDSGFGMNVLRVQQPFDFAGREGHIHYTSDMKGHLRMHQSVHIGPVISNSLPDLRFINVLEALNGGTAIDIDFLGDGGWPFEITIWRNGQKAEQWHANGPIGVLKGSPTDVDIYVSRTRVRINFNNAEVFNQVIPDLTFDRAYVYFAQLAYNPVKDGYPGDANNRFMWDNFAFDGPSLPKNSLTPADKQDILFRAFDKKSCTVRGVPADGPINPSNNHIFDTWHTQIGINDAPITLSDIQCVSSGGTPSLGQADIGNIQVIKR